MVLLASEDVGDDGAVADLAVHDALRLVEDRARNVDATLGALEALLVELLADGMHAVVELLDDLGTSTTHRRTFGRSGATLLVAVRVAVGSLEVSSSRHGVAAAVAQEALEMEVLAARWYGRRRDVVAALGAWIYCFVSHC